MKARLESTLRITKEIEPYIAAANNAEAWQVRQLANKLRLAANKENRGLGGLSVLDALLLAAHCDHIVER
jgi:hypothetical protein